MKEFKYLKNESLRNNINNSSTSVKLSSKILSNIDKTVKEVLEMEDFFNTYNWKSCKLADTEPSIKKVNNVGKNKK
jgi:hypothetical protein